MESWVVLQLIFTDGLQTLKWLQPVLYLSILDPCSAVRVADALQTALKTDPLPQRSLKTSEDSQGSQNIVYLHTGYESPAFVLCWALSLNLLFPPIQVVYNFYCWMGKRVACVGGRWAAQGHFVPIHSFGSICIFMKYQCPLAMSAVGILSLIAQHPHLCCKWGLSGGEPKLLLYISCRQPL